ncbi:hypothetical protein NQ318_018136, partial [Aromia moschata]
KGKTPFTTETEKDGVLPFLDVLVKNVQTIASWPIEYTGTKTHTDRYLNATSHHHPQQKRSLIKTLVYRAETICDDESRPEELKQIKEALTKNGYKENRQSMPHPENKRVTDKLKKTLSKKNIGVRFRTVKKIQQVLPSNKDPVPRLLTKGVYELKCTCGKSYIGQTGRSIQCRIKEPQRHTRLGNTDKSAIAEHG